MQRMLLTGIGLVFALVLLVQFGVVPQRTAAAEDRALAGALREEIETAQAAIDRALGLRAGLEANRMAIRSFAANIPMPVLGNYLLDMEKTLRAAAERSGVEVLEVADQDVIDLSAWNDSFKLYTVRVSAEAGLPELIRCLGAIQDANPLASITGLNIEPQDGKPEKHRIRFVAAWLVWAKPEGRPAFLDGRNP